MISRYIRSTPSIFICYHKLLLIHIKYHIIFHYSRHLFFLLSSSSTNCHESVHLVSRWRRIVYQCVGLPNFVVDEYIGDQDIKTLRRYPTQVDPSRPAPSGPDTSKYTDTNGQPDPTGVLLRQEICIREYEVVRWGPNESTIFVPRLSPFIGSEELRRWPTVL